MLGAILKNADSKESNYLYLKNQNNNLIYYGFCVKNDNVYPIDKNIIDTVYNLVKVNDSCEYIGDYLNYKVYLDKENNLKHYLKNGIEDFEMFFKNNGEDLILYGKHGAKNSDSKKFHIGKYILLISLGVLTTIMSYLVAIPVIRTINSKGNFTNNIQYSLAKPVYSISEFLNLDLKCIDVSEALELITSSQLSDNVKNMLANEKLLNDVFPYYKDTEMEYIIKIKLKNLKVRIYEPDEAIITDSNTTNGFYNDLIPNVLNVKNIKNYEDNLKHEFIHLLQSPDRKYIFLHEAVAEIAANEYLDKSSSSYIAAVLNTQLLMDTIGPKIVWETVFSGDDTNLVNVLKNNLNESDYNELMLYLKSRPEDVQSDSMRINEIISNLYRNINSKNIRDDRNIYKEDGYRISRYYFNSEKMNTENKKSINEIFSDQVVSTNNLVK